MLSSAIITMTTSLSSHDLSVNVWIQSVDILACCQGSIGSSAHMEALKVFDICKLFTTLVKTKRTGECDVSKTVDRSGNSGMFCLCGAAMVSSRCWGETCDATSPLSSNPIMFLLINSHCRPWFKPLFYAPLRLNKLIQPQTS